MRCELINFVNLNQDDIMLVLSWRNNFKISKFMQNKSIKLSQHLEFIKSLKSDKSKLYFLVKLKGLYIGVINFIDIGTDCAEFGIYSNPDLYGQGNFLMLEILNYSFDILKLSKLLAKAYIKNQKAISLYERFGFESYKKDGEFIYFCLSKDKFDKMDKIIKK